MKSSVYRRLNTKKQMIRPIDNCKDITVWDAFGAAKTGDNESLVITKNNNTIAYMNAWIRPSYSFSQYNYLYFNVYTDNLTNFVSLGITFHSTAGDAINYIGIWISSLVVGWNRVRVKKSDFTAFGSGTWDTVAEIRFTANYDTNAITRVFKFNNIKVSR